MPTCLCSALPERSVQPTILGYGKYCLAQHLDNLTEWKIGTWSMWSGLPVGQHYEEIMSAHYHNSEPSSSQSNNLKVDSCRFLARLLTLLAYGKDWSVQCQGNVTVWNGISGHDYNSLVSQ